MVWVFARVTDGNLASLVKRIETLVRQHEDKKLASMVTFVGPDADELKRAVAEFEKRHGFKHVVLAIPKDHKQGHRRLKLHPKAEVTVMVYVGKKIKSSHVAGSGGVTNGFIDRVAAETTRVLR